MSSNRFSRVFRECKRPAWLVSTLACSILIAGCHGNQNIRGSMVDVDVARWEILAQTEVSLPPASQLYIDLMEELQIDPSRKYRIVNQYAEESGGSPHIQLEQELQVNAIGTYHNFRLVNHDWAIWVVDVEVVFEDGATWNPDMFGLYYADSASEIVAVPEGPRGISQINAVFQGPEPGLFEILFEHFPLVYFWGERSE